jgi:N-dimethylarginine dimethylaminohydrolase
MKSKALVFSEFDQLKEVIIGKAYEPAAFDYLKDLELKDLLQKILTETEEDLLTLVKIFKDLGVVVHRPKSNFDLNKNQDPYEFDLQMFQFTFPNHPLMPRDTLFVYGNKMVETFTGSPGRVLENWSYRDILKSYFLNGADWVSMPFPTLKNKSNYSEFNSQNEILFHAANMIRCGKHIIVSHPTRKEKWTGKGTELGIEWMKRQFPDTQFIQAPCQGHIDGKIALLKPGVLATWDAEYLPDCFKKWKHIKIDSPPPFPEHFLKIKKQRFYKEFVKQWLSEWIGYVDETVFDVNMFSVSPQLVITNGYNKKAYDEFKESGIEAIPWSFRHQYFWDGAIHCVTLDMRREGEAEDYLC